MKGEEGSSSKRMDDRKSSPSADKEEGINVDISSQVAASGSCKNIREEHAGETGGEAMHPESRGTVTLGKRENELQMEKEDDPWGGLAGPHAGPSAGAELSHVLTQEDLQGLRRRKIDREWREGRRGSELGGEGAREGAWMKAHRFNAGF
jgi:hypothetical protein